MTWPVSPSGCAQATVRPSPEIVSGWHWDTTGVKRAKILESLDLLSLLVKFHSRRRVPPARSDRRSFWSLGDRPTRTVPPAEKTSSVTGSPLFQGAGGTGPAQGHCRTIPSAPWMKRLRPSEAKATDEAGEMGSDTVS